MSRLQTITKERNRTGRLCPIYTQTLKFVFTSCKRTVLLTIISPSWGHFNFECQIFYLDKTQSLPKASDIYSDVRHNL